MTLAFSPPPSPDSPLGRLDPRWKLAGVLLVAVAVALARTPAGAAVGLLLACVLAVLTRAGARWYLVRLAPVVLVVVVFTLPLPFLLEGDVLWRWRSLIVTRRGVEMGLLVSTKAVALVTLMLVLLASAPLHVTLKAAQSLFTPRPAI